MPKPCTLKPNMEPDPGPCKDDGRAQKFHASLVEDEHL